MAQTIVNFLTQNTSGVLSISSRVFDYAIGSTEQTIYLNLMEDLQAAITADDDDTIAAIVNQLNNWSKLKESTVDNVTVNQNLTISDLRNPPTTKTWTSSNPVTTMNRGMAEAVDKIIRTLRSAGWDPTITNPGAAALTALATIKANPSIYPLVQYVTDGINQANGAVLNTGVQDITGTSLQQMLMVDYVSRGNDLLFSEMSGLSDAINLNQTALSYLNSLQDLMNQKDPKAFLLALDKISGVYSSAMTAEKYSDFEKASFDQELGTTAKFTDAQINSYVALLLNPNYTTNMTSLSTEAQALSNNALKPSALAAFDTLKTTIEAWPPALVDSANAKQTFLSAYTTFLTQDTTFEAAKSAYVSAVASSTQPSQALATAVNNLVSAIENLTTTYQTLASATNTLITEASGDPTYLLQLTNDATTVFTTYWENKTPTQWTPTLSSVKSVYSQMQSTDTGSAAGAFVNLETATTTFTGQLARIRSNLSYLITNLEATSGATSLKTSLQSVLDDFNGITEIKNWVQDYSSANQGSYQTHLNNAIVASQALNDAKREDLRRVMFVFEEFYKSATSMLSRLTQLIERMGSAINR